MFMNKLICPIKVSFCKCQRIGIMQIISLVTMERRNNNIYYVFYSMKVKVKSCSVMSNSLRPHGVYGSWNSPGQNTGVDSLSLLWGIFPTQESNQGLLHCRWILYQLSYQGSSLTWLLLGLSQKMYYTKHFVKNYAFLQQWIGKPRK